MALETAATIDQLVATNPPDTDPGRQGAAHLRLIKGAIKGTFPSLTGAVTVTADDLNWVPANRANVLVATSAGDVSITGNLTANAASKSVKLGPTSVTGNLGINGNISAVTASVTSLGATGTVTAKTVDVAGTLTSKSIVCVDLVADTNITANSTVIANGLQANYLAVAASASIASLGAPSITANFLGVNQVITAANLNVTGTVGVNGKVTFNGDVLVANLTSNGPLKATGLFTRYGSDGGFGNNVINFTYDANGLGVWIDHSFIGFLTTR